MTTDGPAVLTAAADGVLTITLNRARVRNAINEALSQGVADALARLDADPELHVAVITGAGGTFCAGMDLRAFSDRPPQEPAAALARLSQHSTSKPLIAAIEGFAVGGGLEFALACDLIVTASDAKLGIPEVVRSLVPSGGALLRLPTRLPYGVALDMALTGTPISGQRAYDLGLASRVADPGGALDAALEAATAIAKAGPLAVAGSKAVIERRIAGAVTDQEWAEQFAVTTKINTSADALEGIRAFLEKREPRFSGRF